MTPLPVVFAKAKKDQAIGIWIVSYHCWDCGSHHYNGGPTTGPPRAGLRTTPCGRRVRINVDSQVEQ